MYFHHSVLLLLLFWKFYAAGSREEEKFGNCNLEYCYMISKLSVNWTTSYSICTGHGGSLFSWKHTAYTEEWMRLIHYDARIWTSLRRINRLFQWQYQLPEYLPIRASDWISDHPVSGRDCVVINSKNRYESVYCNTSYPAICVIEKLQKQLMIENLKRDLSERATLKVKLLESTIFNPSFKGSNVSRDRKESFIDILQSFFDFILPGKKTKQIPKDLEVDRPMHLNIDQEELAVFELKCNVSGLKHGLRRYLEFAWLKDGVFLNNHNRTKLKLENVKDNSKTVPTGVYQKQGTYQCQIREFGSTKTIISNPVLVTYRHVYNGVITLRTNENQPIDIVSVMDKVVNCIQELSLKNVLNVKFTVAWDTIYHLIGSKVEEFRHSLYVDFTSAHPPDSSVSYILDAITERLDDSALHRIWGIRSATVNWATYCPKTVQQLSGLTIHWPSFWSSKEQYVYCNTRYTNYGETLSRQCAYDFIQGAKGKVISLSQCTQIIGPLPNDLCLPGYQWLENSNVCYRITPAAVSWTDALSPCFSEYPTENLMQQVNYDTLVSVAKQLQQSVEVSELWLPVHRPSIYGPLLYYPTTDDETVSIGKLEAIRNPDEEECQMLTGKGSVETTNCTSANALPALCAYHQKSQTVKLDNLCPAPWYGFRVYRNRLICFLLVTIDSPLTWNEANQTCRQFQPDFAVDVSMATFNQHFKAQLWELVRRFWKSEINSSWIGLRRSEEDSSQFCWYDDCHLEFFNWNLSTTRENGKYGIMHRDGSWGLLPATERLNQVLCQSIIDLSIHSDIRVQLKGSNNSFNTYQVDLQQSERWKKLVPKSFGNFSQLLSTETNWMTFRAPENRVRCYADGQLFFVMRKPSEEFFVANSSKSFHCEGFIGWPRRYVRSQYIWAKRTAKTEIFLLTLSDVRDHFDHTQVEKDLIQDGVDVRVTATRRFRDPNRQMLLRLELMTNKQSHSEQALLQLIRKRLSLQSSYKIVSVRSTVLCPEVTEGQQSQHTWIATPIGQTAQPDNLCLTNDGRPAFIRTCLSSPFYGAYWSPISTESATCSPPGELYLTLQSLNEQILSSKLNSSDALNHLAALGSNYRHPSELSLAVKLLEVGVKSTVDLSCFQNASQSLVNIMESSSEQLQGAQAIPGVSDSVVTSLEQIMGQVDLSEKGETAFQHPKLVIESVEVNSSSFEQIVGFGANLNNDKTICNSSRIMGKTSHEELIVKDVVVLLPMEEIQKRINSLRVSFSLLANADLIDASPITHLPGDSPDYVVGSPVIVAQVGNSSISNLTKAIRILFRSSTTQQPVCVYWDKLISGWATRGCRHIGTMDQDLHICECNHLTPLALLIPYSDASEDDAVLGWISIVGCIISMISLFLVMLTYLMFSKWRKSLGNKILFNLSVSLFGLLCSFLTAGQMSGYDKKCPMSGYDEQRFCITAAAFTHYFLLSSFAWMLVEAIYQYVAYVVIIGVQTYKSRFMRKAMPFAWGLPFLPIIGLLIYDPSMYLGQKNFCWMSLERGFYPFVLAPVSAVLLINMVVYALMLKSVICIKLGLRTNQSNSTLLWYQLRLSLCVFFLLGLAWIFGFLSIGRNNASLVFAYLFCIFNSLQGFAIFVFFVLRERSARKLWSNFVSSDQSEPHSVIKNTQTSTSSQF